MPYTPVINLKYNREGCLLNCFGMQPIFYTNIGKQRQIPFVDIFCVDRLQNKKYPEGKIRIHTRVSENNYDIFPKTFHYNFSDQKVVNTLLEYSDHFKVKYTNEKDLKEKILYQAEFIKYRTTLSKANFFISSNEEILSSLNYKFTELNKYERFLVDDNILSKDILIIGSRELNTFSNPICACPLIELNAWNNFVGNKLNGRIDMSKNLPIIEKELDRYELLQLFLDVNDIETWYIHKFLDSRIKAPYISIHL